MTYVGDIYDVHNVNYVLYIIPLVRIICRKSTTFIEELHYKLIPASNARVCLLHELSCMKASVLHIEITYHIDFVD